VLGYVTTTPWALGTAGRVADQFRDEDVALPLDTAAAQDDAAPVAAG
jgi:hypothetical protein